MNQQRRLLLKGTMAGTSLVVAMGAGLLTPASVLAAWPEKAFKAQKTEEAMSTLVGGDTTTPSDQITIEAPDIAENGAVVSVTAKTSIPDAESISLFVPVNTFPLASSYELTSAFGGYVTSRIKMAKTSDVVAVVKAKGKLYSAKRSVKVTLGGCGG